MNKIINILTFIATLLLAILAGLAVWSAFSGPLRTKFIVNSPVFIFFWISLVVIIFISLFCLGNPFRRPGLFLIFAAVLCIIIGGLAGSTDANILLKKYLKINKVHKAIMPLSKGRSQDIVLLDNFDINKDPQSGGTGRLPFSIKLNSFHIEVYEPGTLYIENPQKQFWQMEAVEGAEKNLDPNSGSIKILKVFKNLRYVTENGRTFAKDVSGEGFNGAVEIEYTAVFGSKIKKYIYAIMPNPVLPDDKIFVTYVQAGIKDLSSKIEIVKDGKTLSSATVRFNKPFHYGGYYIYQFDLDRQSGQFSVLQVISDTGLSIIYAGFGLLILGVFWNFWFHIIANKIRHKV